MIDLINKLKNISPDKYQEMYVKFSPIIEVIPKHLIFDEMLLIYVLNQSVDHIKLNYHDLNADISTWTIVVIKDLLLNYKITKETDIYDNIIEFIDYYNQNYQIYLLNMDSWVNDYYRDVRFVKEYINKKIGS